jgi:tetratricopeptide (TPR) repeat protein
VVSATGTESKGKARRLLTEQARRFAAEGRWHDAIEVNQQIIERTPRDADAHNRLGKAFYELRRYRSAYEAYQKASTIDPANVIAQRNLSRIEPLKDVESDADLEDRSRDLRPGIFIEEVGKTYLDDLVNCAGPEILSDLSSGDPLFMRVDGQRIDVVDAHERYVGQLEPRVARRMLELLALGNQYDVYITSGSSTSVRIIIRETFKAAAMGGRLSFPRQGKVNIPRAYLRDTRLFRDEPDMLLGDDDDDEGDTEEIDEFDAAESDEEESDYVEESGATVDDEEEDAI